MGPRQAITQTRRVHSTCNLDDSRIRGPAETACLSVSDERSLNKKRSEGCVQEAEYEASHFLFFCFDHDLHIRLTTMLYDDHGAFKNHAGIVHRSSRWFNRDIIFSSGLPGCFY